MMRGGAVVIICPNVPSVIIVSGLRNSAWFKMLKNSARNSILSLSPTSGVALATARSKLDSPGPLKAFLGSVPYVRKAGLATACAEVGKVLVVKFAGLKK